MSLTDYLAKNYLTADINSEKPKKRKRKEKGLIIADEDEKLTWKPQGTSRENSDGPVTGSCSLCFFWPHHVLTCRT